MNLKNEPQLYGQLFFGVAIGVTTGNCREYGTALRIVAHASFLSNMTNSALCFLNICQCISIKLFLRSKG